METLFYEGIDSHSTYFITPIFNKYKLTKYFKLILEVMIDDCVQFSGAIHGNFQIFFAICHLSLHCLVHFADWPRVLRNV